MEDHSNKDNESNIPYIDPYEIWKLEDKWKVKDFCLHRLSFAKTEEEKINLIFVAAAACREVNLYEDCINLINIITEKTKKSNITIAIDTDTQVEWRENFLNVTRHRLVVLCHTQIANNRYHLKFRGVEVGALETFRVLDKFFPDHPDVNHIKNRLRSINAIKEEDHSASNINPSDICVVTSYDDKYAPIGDICAKTLLKYCDIHGYKPKVIKNYNSGRHPMWDKIAIIDSLLSEEIPYVFWVDADSMFIRYDKKIGDQIDDRHNLYLTSGWMVVHPGPGDIIFRESANSGVMLFKNNEWSKKFIKKVWAQDQFVNTRLADNAAILHIMGYDSFINSGKETNSPDFELIGKIKFLDFNWNSHPIGSMGSDPIIMHYAGMSFSERVQDMTLQLERTFPQ